MEIAFSGQNFSVALLTREIRSVPQVFEIVLRPRIALCIPFTSDGKLLLIREHRAAVDAVVMEFPAGRLELDEKSETAIRREVLEETGFHATLLRSLGTLLTSPHFSSEVMDVFVAEGQVLSPPTPTTREDLREIVQVAPSEIDELIRSGQIMDAKTIAALALARAVEPGLEALR
jgi:ADP-ribose pyrophosphatase